MKTPNKKEATQATAASQKEAEVSQHPHDENVECKECSVISMRLELLDSGGKCNNCGTTAE